ncbi:hypothetical protein [Cryobacterium sp. SO1]|uniref:hypothetical protein n=1 Tax=Cryobacterium sp. SO1 TaxID=1897061 RepID=UPI0013EEB3AA|nr:hypothetical protein [Cryobacterium sp. SO1]
MTRWTPTDRPPVLWMSALSEFAPDRPICDGDVQDDSITLAPGAAHTMSAVIAAI